MTLPAFLLGCIGGLLAAYRLLAPKPKTPCATLSIVRFGGFISVRYSTGSETWLFVANVSEQGRIVEHMLDRPNGLSAGDVTEICSGLKRLGAKPEAMECANSF